MAVQRLRPRSPYAPRGWAVLPIRGGHRVSLPADGVKDTSKEEGRTL